jgi:hemerythrin
VALISWGKELSVGVEAFDKEHKVLIDHLNELHDAMRNGKSNEVIGHVLDELVRYTVHHFSHEEEMFDQYDYPGSEEHKMQHRAFTDKAAALQKDFDAGKLFISVEVMNFLIDWVQNHIHGSDKAYTAFFGDKAISEG